MHPEIQKFWEDSGYEIKEFSHPNCIYYAVFPISSRMRNVVAVKESKGDIESMEYYFREIDAKPRSEEEMLKIIKLKVFL